MSGERDLLRYFQSRLEEALILLRHLVEIESNSRDKTGVDALAEYLAGEFRAAGARVDILPHSTRGNALEARWREDAVKAPILILGHLDTVWPLGTILSRPFRVEDGRAYGPGVFDMKAGILISLLLGQALSEKRIEPQREVRFFYSADEEIGTESGLPHLRRVAEGCRAALCLEPPLQGGKAKTSRKGVGSFRLRVKGLSAHAGVDYEKGASAILELSRLVLELHKLTDPQRGISVSVGTFHGGTAGNVVPDEAEAEVDFRYVSTPDGEWIKERMRNLQPLDPRCTLTLEGDLNRPPLERTAAVVALYEKARGVAAGLGLDLGEGSTGGGSDGSFTAALGIPTLDGLGVCGDGAHAMHEYVEIQDIPTRCALLCGLLEKIDD